MTVLQTDDLVSYLLPFLADNELMHLHYVCTWWHCAMSSAFVWRQVSKRSPALFQCVLRKIVCSIHKLSSGLKAELIIELLENMLALTSCANLTAAEFRKFIFSYDVLLGRDKTDDIDCALHLMIESVLFYA